MKYEPQINWADVYDANLDADSSGLARNGSIYLLSTPTLHPLEQMVNSEVCTLYDRKNYTNSYNFLQIKQVHALDSSVSFKPTSVDFTIVLHMLSFWQF